MQTPVESIRSAMADLTALSQAYADALVAYHQAPVEARTTDTMLLAHNRMNEMARYIAELP